jgi:hypothetical protein
MGGTRRDHRDLDAPHAGRDQRADLQELEPGRAGGGIGQLGGRRRTLRRLHQDVGQRDEP